MRNTLFSLIAVTFAVFAAAGQANAESAMQQLQDAAKSYNHAVSVFDGSRLAK